MNARIERFLVPLVAVILSSCARSKIWNASDLAEWVKDEATRQGYVRESIQLEEWYRKEDGENVWHGQGKDARTGQRNDFAIPVDKVWKPSSDQ